ncbi:MAG TPA: methionine synthase [Bacteroidetes bacterium]|nr:methionine synthase [Bacteroidota bacterium]
MTSTFLDRVREKVVVFDGATGTHFQNQGLTADDFGGEHLAGCNEYLVVSKPSAVERVHSDYLDAGCDVVETDTFGATSVVLAEYGLQDRTYEINFAAAQIARRVASDFSLSGHPRFVAGSMGPTTKLPSLGHISFVDLSAAYYEQARGLLEGGVDLLSVETCQDILQTKAALYGIFRLFGEVRRKVPVIASVTVEATGTMLLGTEIGAALTSLEPYDIDVIGMNCATGPKEMSEHVRVLADASPLPLFVMPNAGLPENVGGHAHYSLSPEDLVRYLAHFVKDLGVNVVGGCCGTTKEHIRQLVQAVGGLSPVPRKPEFVAGASSLYQSAPFRIDNPPVLIGERTNANGSKLFRDLLAKDDWEGIVAMGKDQVREQAHLLDVCAAYVGREERADMKEIISRFNRQITIPLVIDSTEPPVIEEALQHIAGKAVVNSINLEDGEERLARVTRLCRQYGAAVIALTIDEQGMAKTVDAKVAVAKRIYDLAVRTHGMKPHDLVFDALTFTLGSGEEEFRRAGANTIEAIRRIKSELPGVHTILGVSNISFGLAPNIRAALNSVFLHYAVEAGLDMAIVHASKIIPLFKLDERTREICRQLVFDERRFEGEGDDRAVTYDPLTELLAYASGKTRETAAIPAVAAPVEERLKTRIIDGNKVGLQKDLDEARTTHPPLEIINTFLLDGMKVVGELFGSGQMQLPFVLQSAEVMKAAVAYLEPFMEKKEGSTKGTLVIATVKGDVHDIGKNLVDIILSNNGYKVFNLGIKCPLENMLHAHETNSANAIGMSGLLVKSTLVMKENLAVMSERGLRVPVILGGAALTRRYVEQDLRSVYDGPVYYARDAFDGLRLMETIMSGGSPTQVQDEVDATQLTGTEAKIAMSLEEHAGAGTDVRSDVSRDVHIPTPPFWGSRVANDIRLDDVFTYVNDVALIRGQWRVVKGKLSAEEYQTVLRDKVLPEYESLKNKIRAEGLLQPKAVYGYFPCQSQGDDLILYDVPKDGSPPDDGTEALRLSFPRQPKGRRLCIADFFAPVSSGKIDVIGMHLVTVGRRASEYAHQLFTSDNYKDYLYFHGLSVESAEALAELWHKKIREELGIAGKDAPEIKRLFSQGYQGARYSFGYPACPNLEDQKKIFTLLRPERIGVALSEEFQLEPEQSTSAIIVHHPEARYFNI